MKSPKERCLGAHNSACRRMLELFCGRFHFVHKHTTGESWVPSRASRISLKSSRGLCHFLLLGQLTFPAGSLFLERHIFIVLLVFPSLMNRFMAWIQIMEFLWRKAEGQGGREGQECGEKGYSSVVGMPFKTLHRFSFLSDNLLTLSYATSDCNYFSLLVWPILETWTMHSTAIRSALKPRNEAYISCCHWSCYDIFFFPKEIPSCQQAWNKFFQTANMTFVVESRIFYTINLYSHETQFISFVFH